MNKLNYHVAASLLICTSLQSDCKDQDVVDSVLDQFRGFFWPGDFFNTIIEDVHTFSVVVVVFTLADN